MFVLFLTFCDLSKTLLFPLHTLSFFCARSRKIRRKCKIPSLSKLFSLMFIQLVRDKNPVDHKEKNQHLSETRKEKQREINVTTDN